MHMIDAHPQQYRLQTLLIAEHFQSVRCMNMLEAHPQIHRLYMPLVMGCFLPVYCMNRVEVSHVPLVPAVENGFTYKHKTMTSFLDGLRPGFFIWNIVTVNEMVFQF